MTLSFNLIDEPWIPVIPRDGPPREVGVRDALVHAHEWREVFDNSPLVTVALHRLLLAILYRALPPRSQDAWDALWDELWQAARLPEAPIVAYLEQWRDRFDLFSETHPFYQTAGLTIESANDGTSPVSRLAHELASGNNATLFDHRSDASGHAMSAASAARLLIAAQTFSMGGGNSGKAILAGKHFNRSNAQHGLLVNGLCAWIAGNTFRETLLLNLVPDDFAPDDIPPWEASTATPEHMILAADSATARGRIDLLTWQARLIRLIGEHHGQETVVHRVYITQGRPAGDTGVV
ncbi:MAG TPA: type I-E CRISPR-associated protein Cse1/CasA, partial [Armatimonadota bacterium]|nr:type I-E CRISPR-associated protein Cse1/CasA [Armatimonadota bacterium]